jgi:hypothetical protein
MKQTGSESGEEIKNKDKERLLVLHTLQTSSPLYLSEPVPVIVYAVKSANVSVYGRKPHCTLI